MSDITRTIASTTGTVPENFVVTSGTVTTDTVDTTLLQYTGPINLQTFLDKNGANGIGPAGTLGLNDGNTGAQGIWFIFCPAVSAGANKIGKILGVNFVGMSGNNFEYAIQTDTVMTGLSGSACYLIEGNLVAYSYDNTGGAAATVYQGLLNAGTSIAAGAGAEFKKKVKFPTMGDLYRPIYVDASATTLTIAESRLGQ